MNQLYKRSLNSQLAEIENERADLLGSDGEPRVYQRIEQLKKSAASGDPMANCILGLFYLDGGCDVSVDVIQAFSAFSAAKDAGFYLAGEFLVDLYTRKEDFKSAALLARETLAKGNRNDLPWSTYAVGVEYLLEDNEMQALASFKTSYDAGHLGAGVLYAGLILEQKEKYVPQAHLALEILKVVLPKYRDIAAAAYAPHHVQISLGNAADLVAENTYGEESQRWALWARQWGSDRADQKQKIAKYEELKELNVGGTVLTFDVRPVEILSDRLDRRSHLVGGAGNPVVIHEETQKIRVRYQNGSTDEVSAKYSMAVHSGDKGLLILVGSKEKNTAIPIALVGQGGSIQYMRSFGDAYRLACKKWFDLTGKRGWVATVLAFGLLMAIFPFNFGLIWLKRRADSVARSIQERCLELAKALS